MELNESDCNKDEVCIFSFLTQNLFQLDLNNDQEDTFKFEEKDAVLKNFS